MVSPVTLMMLRIELNCGAKLHRYPQIVGGFKWTLTGARAVPASLDEICESLLNDGILDQKDTGEYTLWPHL